MLNIGTRRMKKIKILSSILLFVFTACSVNPPQAVSTLPISEDQVIDETDVIEIATSTPLPTDSEGLPTETPENNLVKDPVISFPDPAAYSWNTIVDGLSKPIGLASAGDGSQRLFIIEQDGRIIVVERGTRREKAFLDIRDLVGTNGSERGLLGIAFHPRFQENGYFYVNYTDKRGDTVISRFQVSNQDPNLADPDSEQRVLQVNQPYANHNGGGLAFGPDGYLYIGLGDGGSGGDPQGYAQSTGTLLGKLLRIDVDTAEKEGKPYTIPADNPFRSGEGLPEIWAYGLRNPWRFSFDRLSGDLFIGDVGQNQWEEINYLGVDGPGGVNFGWNFREGSHLFTGTAPSGLVNPIFEYDHSLGCSVTGGVVYRGQEFPDWQGIYLLGDYCSGNIWGLFQEPERVWKSQLLYTGLGNITSFGEDDSGEIYLVIHGGKLLKLSSNTP